MNLTLTQIKLADEHYSELRKFVANKAYVSEVENATSFLDTTATVKQRFWHILNNIYTAQLCKCGTVLKWNNKDNSYRRFCSSKCAHTDNSVKLKIKQTCLDKFGSETNLTSSAAREHYTAKMMEKYGVDNPFKSATVQQQIRDEVYTKYGVTSISKVDSVKEKITSAHQSKYNRVRANQQHFSDESYSTKFDKQRLIELYSDGSSIQDIANELKVGHSQLCVQFKQFGIEVHQSAGQTQLYNYIKSIYSGTVILNDRKMLNGKEIDIYIPEFNLGVEYDGIFWHSQDSAGKINYHAEKDALAAKNGVKLIHVIDIEWKTKQDIVKSRIASMLGCNNTIYGRKTQIEIIDSKVANKFFSANHIQGNASASLYVGLKYQNRLVAAMSIGKSRYNKSQFELIRFCNMLGYTVVGGASKLFKFAVSHLNAREIISFADLRWGTGKLYSSLGFTHVRDNAPSFIYTHCYQTLENRVRYQKHKLAECLPIYNAELSAWENMKINGYDRYWNSGNAVWIWSM